MFNPYLTKFIEMVNIHIEDGKITYTMRGAESTRELPFNIEVIHKQLRKIGDQKPYNSNNYKEYRSKELEEACIPQIGFVYYYFIYKNLKIPTLRELTNYYVKLFCVSDALRGEFYHFREELNIYLAFTYKSLIGRIYRAYNSFNREIEVLYKIDNYLDSNFSIYYDYHDDFHGVDFTIRNNNNDKTLGVATYAKTNNSMKYKNMKNVYRHDYTGKTMVDLIANMRYDGNCENINGIYVYSSSYISKKVKDIQEELK